MRKIFIVTLLIICISNTYSQNGIQNLVKAYPNFLSSSENNHIVWKDGTKMIYDDGVVRTDLEDLLDHASLKDQMSQIYPKGEQSNPPKENFEPGRIRYEPFFMKMYGSTKAEVQRNLVNIKWFNQSIQVTKINNVDTKLKAVLEDLKKLSPEYQDFVKNVGGTFNWRYIKGTQRRSFHSFGAAIDINVKYSHYWMWAKKDEKGRYIYQNKIPYKIVEIFEKHGFIWGGKWYHFDTMHFEYRPELL